MWKYILFALAIAPIVFFIMCVIISAFNYISQEIRHSFRNAKRSVKEFLWRIEWELKH